MYILYVYAIMAPAHESETIVFNFRKLLSTLPNYAELLYHVNLAMSEIQTLTLVVIGSGRPVYPN
jgi:hypothetical protein